MVGFTTLHGAHISIEKHVKLVDGVSLRNGDVKHHVLSSKISILLL